MNATPTILWLRKDLRLDDHPALSWALERGGPVLPVFISDPRSEGAAADGDAARAWLHRSLKSLAGRLDALGGRLILRRGPSLETLLSLVRETGADAVAWNRRYEPDVIGRDSAVKKALLAAGVEVRSFNGSLLFAPNRVENKAGLPFRVFTPFWKHCLGQAVRPAIPYSLDRWPAHTGTVDSEPLDSLGLRPDVSWDAGLFRIWEPGEPAALARLDHFAGEIVSGYATNRDRPDLDGSSRLSPHLHWGEISPVRIFHRIRAADAGRGGEVFLSEIGWREFAHHLLFHFPDTIDQPLRPEFRSFPWETDAAVLRAWQRGQTGYPIVDAGMRQLWATGWMHNRVRMVVASFLVKHLLQPWQAGAAWFRDTLVDADLASNTLGWQWTAGCGADAAPYFRVFNPMLQGDRFDPEGAYVRKWVPELARLPSVWIQRPWEAPAAVLQEAGLELGHDYPAPLVDHAAARNRALAAYERIRQKG
ncbi:MAG: deoxyribodipyrimidine photo-lyase [Opitutaceae bacterium]